MANVHAVTTIQSLDPQWIYDFDGAILGNDNIAYISEKTFNLKKEVSIQDYIAIRYDGNCYIFVVIGKTHISTELLEKADNKAKEASNISIKNKIKTMYRSSALSAVLPDEKYWKNEEMKKEALKDGHFLICRFLDKQPLNKYNMSATGQIISNAFEKEQVLKNYVLE